MVFDLKVQAAQEPRCYAAAPGEVHGSLNLMYCRRVFDSPSVVSGQGKLRLLHAMRHLKYNAQHQTEHNRRCGVEQRYDPDWMKQQGNPEC